MGFCLLLNLCPSTNGGNDMSVQLSRDDWNAARVVSPERV